MLRVHYRDAVLWVVEYGPCYKCGGVLERVHRNVVERLFVAEAYRCLECCDKAYAFYRWWFSPYRFIFSRRTLCPRCGTFRVYRIQQRDPLDSTSRNLLSLIQLVLGAPRNRCPNCRMQYADFRSAVPALRSSKEPQNPLARREAAQP